MCSGPPGPDLRAQGLRRRRRRGRASRGCHPGDCHYIDSRTTRPCGASSCCSGRSRPWASSRRGSSSSGPARPRAQRLADEITRITEEVRALGPLNWTAASVADVDGSSSTRRWQATRGDAGGAAPGSGRSRPGHGGGQPSARASMTRRAGPPASRGHGMTAKPNLAMYWAASCGGCDIAVLNIHEHILDVGRDFDIVFWPAVMDAQVRATSRRCRTARSTSRLFNGGIRNDENEPHGPAPAPRSRSSWSRSGRAPARAASRDSPTSRPSSRSSTPPSHARRPTTPTGSGRSATCAAPEGELHLPTLTPLLRTLDQVVAWTTSCRAARPRRSRSPRSCTL